MKLKKMLIGILAVLALLCVSVAAVGCGGEPTVTSVELNNTTAELFVGDSINYSDYKVTVKYSDGKTETVGLNNTMISQADLSKLSVAGTYEISVNVAGKTVMLTVTVQKRDFDGEGIVFIDADSENVISVTYTGAEIKPELDNLPEDAEVKYAFYDGADETGTPVDEAINVGEYFVKATVVRSAYKDVTFTATLKITQAEVDCSALVWNGTNLVYTGDTVVFNPTVEGLPEGITIKEVTGNSKDEPGVYTSTVKFAGENKNYFVKDYKIEWNVIADVTAGNWISIKDGVAKLAKFAKSTEDENKGTLTFDGETANYTLAMDAATKAFTFTLDEGSAFDSITLKGAILTIKKGSDTYSLIYEKSFDKYYAVGYSLYVADFDFVVNAGTARAIITTLGGEAESYDMSLTFGNNEKSASNGKITLAGSDVYFQASMSYSAFSLKVYNYVNDQNVGSDGLVKADSFTLVTKAALDDLLVSRPVGYFTDAEKNVLHVSRNNEITVNGKKAYVFVEGNYASDKPQFIVSWDGDSYDKTLEVVDGYYKLKIGYSSNAFFSIDYKNNIGEYYLESDNGLTDAQKISFNTSSYYYRISTKLIVGEAEKAESKSFDFNAAADKDRFTLTKTASGITANLYLKNETVVYATVIFNTDGTAKVGESTFKKVDKIIEKASYSSGAYYGADGTKLSYNGKGTFTLGENTYKDYTLTYNESVVTVTLAADTAIVIKYDYNEKRYVTVDGAIYLYDGAGNYNSNGFIFGTDYVNGDNKFKLDNGVLKLNDTALTNVAYSFVDDGNDNGRTVLKATAKNGTENVEVLFYSLYSVKVNGAAYVINGMSTLVGAKYLESADASPVLEFNEAGKINCNGAEVFPIFVGTTRLDLRFTAMVNGFEASKQIYFNYGGMKIGFDNNAYYAEAYYTFNGMYKSADKAFYINDSIVYKDEISEVGFGGGCTLTKITSDSLIIKFSGDKLATFSVVEGVKTLVYDGDTYTLDTAFDIDSIFGTYSMLEDSGYSTLNFAKDKLTDVLDGILVENGEYKFKIKYDSSKTGYLIKNVDEVTATGLPYLSVGSSIDTIVGKTKVNGKDFVISIGAGTVDSVVKTVLTVTYDGESANVSRVSYDWRVTLNDIEYKIDKNTGDNKDKSSILVYEFWLKPVTGTYVFNGRTYALETVVNASGENVVKLTVDGVEVNFTIAATHDLIEFVKDAVNYKAVIDANSTPRIVLYTEKEYSAFVKSFDVDKQCYVLTIDGKELTFDYELKNEFLSYNPSSYSFKFAIDAEEYKYGDSALTFGQYIYEAGVIVFTSADGNSYGYDIVSETLYKNVLPDNFELVGIKVSGTTYGLVTNNITITAKLTGFVEGKAVMTVYYEFGSDGDGVRNAATVTALEGNKGFQLVGNVGLDANKKAVTTYLIKEGSSYALYSEEQYLLAGTYTVNEKSLVITGTLSGGKGTYKATYDNGEEAALSVDFAKNSFMLTTADGTFIVTFGITEGALELNATLVPEAALKFIDETGWAYMYAFHCTYSDYYDYNVKVSFKGVEDGKTKFTVSTSSGWSWSDYEGVLSEDGNYISYSVYSTNYRLYLNANASDEYYKYVCVKANSAFNALIGTFTLDGGETLKVELTATSTDNDGKPKRSTSGVKVTYKGSSVVVATYDESATSIEFKIGETTYVATVNSGSVTVTEKAAA